MYSEHETQSRILEKQLQRVNYALLLHGLPVVLLRQLIPTHGVSQHEAPTTTTSHAPELHAEVVLDIIIIPVVLPQLVPARLGHTGGRPLQITQMCLRVVPVYDKSQDAEHT